MRAFGSAIGTTIGRIRTIMLAFGVRTTASHLKPDSGKWSYRDRFSGLWRNLYKGFFLVGQNSIERQELFN